MFVISLFFLSAPLIVLAHPGRTDSSGCHTCRTNCPNWGLSYGEYHCHNSKGIPQPEYPIRSHYGENGTGSTEPWPDYANSGTTINTPGSYLNGYIVPAEVETLQQKLSTDPTLYPEQIVSGYYGPLTQRAIERFQVRYGVVYSGDPYTTGYGRFGPLTRAKFEEVFGF